MRLPPASLRLHLPVQSATFPGEIMKNKMNLISKRPNYTNCFAKAFAYTVFSFLLIFNTPVFAQVVVDVKKLGPRLQSGPVGLCLSYVTDEDSRFPERVQSHSEAMKTMKVGTLRWPMGTLADNYMWHTPGEYDTASSGLKPCLTAPSSAPGKWSWAIESDGSLKEESMDFDEFMTLCMQVNAEPVVMVNAFGHTHKTAIYSYEQLKASAVEQVKYAKSKNYKIKYWEIGNELSVTVKNGDITVKEYISLFNDFTAAMKEEDPTIQTGLGTGFGYEAEVLQGTMKTADFIVPHHYAFDMSTYEGYQNLQQSVGTRSIDRALKAVSALPEPYKSKIKVLVTEFSSFKPNGRWETKANDIGKSLVTFEMAAKLLSQSDNIEYMHFWVTHSPWGGRGDSYANTFDDYINILPQGQAIQMFNTFSHERMLTLNPVSGKVRTYASYSPKTKNLSIYLLNKNTVPETRTVELANYPDIHENGVWVYQGDGAPSSTSTSIDYAGDVTVKNNAFEIILPPVSISVVSFGTMTTGQ